MRLEPRESVSFWMVLFAPVGAICVALALSSGLIMWTGESIVEAYLSLLNGAFGSRFALSETLTRATPLPLPGLAAAVAFRARF